MTRVAGMVILAGALVIALVWLTGVGDAIEHWAAARQLAFQNAMAAALRGLRSGAPGAEVTLIALCFGYGVAHSAGPGHGKVLIGGYGLSGQAGVRRLVALSFAAALAQATSAVILVYAGISAFGWTRERITGLADGALAIAGYAAIAACGGWIALRGIARLRMQHRRRAADPHLPVLPPMPAQRGPDGGYRASGDPAGGAADTHPQADCHAHTPGHGVYGHHAPGASADNVHAQDTSTQHAPSDDAHAHHAPAHAHHAHHHAHDHAHDDACGHRHGPTLAEAEQARGWRDMAVLVGAIAIRPCTGALFLLVLTWRMGLAEVGIAGAYAMGLGTATVTAAVALAARATRAGTAAAFASGVAGGVTARVLPLLELAAGLLVMLVALRLLLPLL